MFTKFDQWEWSMMSCDLVVLKKQTNMAASSVDSSPDSELNPRVISQIEMAHGDCYDDLMI